MTCAPVLHTRRRFRGRAWDGQHAMTTQATAVLGGRSSAATTARAAAGTKTHWHAKAAANAPRVARARAARRTSPARTAHARPSMSTDTIAYDLSWDRKANTRE